MQNPTPTRQTWSSSLTYVLTVAGATIGFGATWRFPYLVGENGGGAYVLVFILAMILVGIPVIWVENVIGRRAHKNAIDAFGGEIKGKSISRVYKIIGYCGIAGAFGIMAYYMVLGGWVITYITNILSGELNLSSPIDKELAQSFYNANIEHNPLMVGIWTSVFVAINWVILKKGIIDGIERSMKYLMPLLFICLFIIVIRNLTLPGAMEGVRFYLLPDFSKITAKLFIDVLGQVFFALSLGFGVMITLSSYLQKNENMIKTAVATGVLNTLIALLAGFMIFPSLFSFGLEPNQGPSLVFQTLPIVFSHIYFGNVLALVFFLLLITAALTTSLPIYEVIITALYEKCHISRVKAINITLGFIFICGNLPCILSYGAWEHITWNGKNIFDNFDFISGNILFVLTSLGTLLFVGYVLKDAAKKELSNNGSLNPQLVGIWYGYVKYILPFVIMLIFIAGVFPETLKNFLAYLQLFFKIL
ncbi:sodium-dependent transporter [Helicobacter sp. MIT 21-1697]|uniref:sodium-dependent transporter n=1 Tax=Helicobacter sp. MIT 21-1697 TaxID=2993733 RepID=UPI00224A8A68|nr:sodium-dependent transporter [Helicobacter sp. MIT 21-1697]MCX2716379.1 sodium-dependent transporter [Helicobacter sp. MIT 21-1697]